MGNDLVSGEEPACLRGKQTEKSVLLGGQFDRSVAKLDKFLSIIDLQLGMTQVQDIVQPLAVCFPA